jgi:hypothetical protein
VLGGARQVQLRRRHAAGALPERLDRPRERELELLRAEREEEREDGVLDQPRLDEIGLGEAHSGQGHLEVRVPPEGDSHGLVLAQPVREGHSVGQVRSRARRGAERVTGAAEHRVGDGAAIVGGLDGAAAQQDPED